MKKEDNNIMILKFNTNKIKLKKNKNNFKHKLKQIIKIQ